MFHDEMGECEAMRIQERLDRIDKARREKAERIARRTLDRINAAAEEEFGHPAEITDNNPHALRIATLAALAALTEKENA